MCKVGALKPFPRKRIIWIPYIVIFGKSYTPRLLWAIIYYTALDNKNLTEEINEELDNFTHKGTDETAGK